MHVAQLLKKIDGPFLSCEFFPPRATESLPDFYAVVERLKSIHPLFASVTYGAGGSRQDARAVDGARGPDVQVRRPCVVARRIQAHGVAGKCRGAACRATESREAPQGHRHGLDDMIRTEEAEPAQPRDML